MPFILLQQFYLSCRLVAYLVKKAQNVPFGMVFLVWLSPLLPRWWGRVMGYGGFRLD